MMSVKKSLRLLVLAVFVGFLAAQILHTHKENISEDQCSICQIIHQTPSITPPAQTIQPLYFIFLSLITKNDEPLLTTSSHVHFDTRAPPLPFLS